jgi:flagellar export protein FliJ
MKAFNFRLETLLRLKMASRERSLIDYAKSIRERQDVEDQLLKANEYIHTLEKKLSEKQKLNFRANDLNSLISGLEDARGVVKEISAELNRKKTMEASRRKIFLKKDSESKSLDRLKERQTYEHIEIESKKEERELDDVIGSRYLYDRANPVL